MILVTGATGNVGSQLVPTLVRRGAQVRALVHTPEKAKIVEGPGVEIVFGDYDDPASLDAAMQGVEALFLLVFPSPDGQRQPDNLIAAANEAGVRRIVKLSALGAAADSPSMLGRWQHESEQRVAASGLAFTHLQPHSFMQNFFNFAPAIAEQGAIYAPMKDGRISAVDVRDIAEVAAAVLTEDGHEGKTYVLTGPEAISYADAARALSEVLGRTVSYVDVPPDAARQGMVDAGLPSWLASEMVALYEIFAAGYAADVSPAVEEITGSPGRTFARFAQDHADRFGGE